MRDTIRFKTKKDIAVSLLREAILSGELEPGEKIAQIDIAKRLGMSPTPVREAIRELQAHGILNYEAHKGVVVAEVDLDQAAEVYEMRELLEARLTSYGCAHLTRGDLQELKGLHVEMCSRTRQGDSQPIRQLNYRFHWLIYEAANRPHWLAEVSRLWTQFPWDTLHVIPDRHVQSMREHERIIDALDGRDCPRAGRCMEAHILAGFNALKEFLTTRRGEGATRSGGSNAEDRP